MASTSASQPPVGPARESDGLRLRAFTLGPFATNCYVVHTASPPPDRPPECVVIDASFESDRIVKHLRDNGLQPTALILTHAHADHIAGVATLKAAFPNLGIWIHHAEGEWLNDPVLNLSEFSGQPITAPAATRLLQDGEQLQICGRPWTVIHTPGHSPGGITLYDPKSGQAFVGDALFTGSIGRTDFPGSDHSILLGSIRDRLYRLPLETIILPGHGPTSTIGRERMSNPFVRG